VDESFEQPNLPRFYDFKDTRLVRHGFEMHLRSRLSSLQFLLLHHPLLALLEFQRGVAVGVHPRD